MAGGHSGGELRIGVTAFKARSLGLIDQIERGELDRIVLTRRGKPVAMLSATPAEPKPLIGCMKGMIQIADGVDLTEPTGEDWGY
jgi:antitoxin (DNA-binding transcriptional repressor) of toxin-antitoxin stability system